MMNELKQKEKEGKKKRDKNADQRGSEEAKEERQNECYIQPTAARQIKEVTKEKCNRGNL